MGTRHVLAVPALFALGCDSAPSAAVQACSPTDGAVSGVRPTAWEYVGLDADAVVALEVHPDDPDVRR